MWGRCVLGRACGVGCVVVGCAGANFEVCGLALHSGVAVGWDEAEGSPWEEQGGSQRTGLRREGSVHVGVPLSAAGVRGNPRLGNGEILGD